VLLDRQPDPRLTAFIVWVPKLGGQESNVEAATQFASDSRATHYWDASAGLVHAYDKVLGLNQDAWDVFMIFGPDARWDGPTPPVPDFWMHNLHLPPAGGENGSHINAAVFAAHADSLLHRPSTTPR
jgi:hypothetical protein